MPPSYSQNSVATKYYQRRSAETYWLRWLGRVLRMSSEFILDNLLCSELVVGNVRLVDRNKDVCKSDLESLNVDIDGWKKLNDDRNKRRASARCVKGKRIFFRRLKKRTNESE